MDSHLQTRTLSDALYMVDDVLKARGTTLLYSKERDCLQSWFAPMCYPRYFNSWAYTAVEFEEAVTKIIQVAPRLAEQLDQPSSLNDFTIVGNCSLDLEFSTGHNGALQIPLILNNGKRVNGAKVTSSSAKIYSNQLIGIHTKKSELVYFYSPNREPKVSAANLAHGIYSSRGDVVHRGVTLKFPEAKTTNLADSPWVKQLISVCGAYYVGNHVSAGEAVVDHNGFFARETHVVQMVYMSPSFDLTEIIINKPFLVFFADQHGVHAAAWFSWDSFGGSIY